MQQQRQAPPRKPARQASLASTNSAQQKLQKPKKKVRMNVGVAAEMSSRGNQRQVDEQIETQTELLTQAGLSSEPSQRLSQDTRGNKKEQRVFEQNREICREHAICVEKKQTPKIPIQVRVTYPLPYTGNINEFMAMPRGERDFLTRVDDSTFGETGAQKDGTKTVITQQSLDFYMAQQWNLDIDNMPGTMPEALSAVQKRFNSYSRKGIQAVKINQGGKPTLQKKFNEWEQEKLDQKLRQLELLYFRSNQDPKIFIMLNQFKKAHPQLSQKGRRGQRVTSASSGKMKLGKHTNVSEFRNEAKDMIPMVYQSTQRVNPLIEKLQVEHEEISKKHQNNPGAPFGDLAQKYYEKKEKEEKEEFKKRMLSHRQLGEQEKSNYLPSCLNVKKRMDSQHLNSWLVRSEIQFAAERQMEFQKLLEKATPEQLQQYRSQTQMTNQGHANASMKQQTITNRVSSSFLQKSKDAFDLTPNGSKNAVRRQARNPTRPLSTTASSVAPRALSSTARYSNRVERVFSQKKQPPNRHAKQMSEKSVSALSRSCLRVKILDTDSEIAEEQMIFNDRVRASIDSTPTKQLLSQDNNRHWKVQSQLVGSSANHKRAQTPLGRGNISKNDKFGNRAKATTVCQFQQKGQQTLQNLITSTKQEPDELEVLQTIRNKTSSYKKASKSSQSYTIEIVKLGNKHSRHSTKNMKTQPTVNNIDINSSKEMEEFSINHVSFAEKANEALFQSTSWLPSKNRVFGDLIEAQDDRSRVSNLFNSSRWQHDKDGLVNSINHHMQRHRPRVKLSVEQEKKREELTGRNLQGNTQLHHRLTRKYGMKDIAAVEMPPQVELYIKEAPDLIANKAELDNIVRKARDYKNDMCSVLNQKTAFTTLNDYDSTQQYQKTQATDLPSSTRSQQQLKAKNEKSRQYSEVPLDPKPDVLRMVAERTEHVKKTLIQRIHETTSRPKRRWRKSIDYAEEENPTSRGFKARNDTVRTKSQTATSFQALAQGKKLSDRGRSAMTRTTIGQNENNNSKTFPTLEARTPGIGGKVKGAALKRVSHEILKALDIEIVEKVYEKSLAQLSMPGVNRDQLWLNKHFYDMEGSDFWLQKGLHCSKEGKADAALDYYRQGLRKCPTDQVLLFSLALGYLELAKFESAICWFSFGLKLNPRWINGLCGVAIAFFNIQNYAKALEYICLAKDNFKMDSNKLPIDEKSTQLTDELPPYAAKLSLNTITLIQATCLKMTQQLESAGNTYSSLGTIFALHRGKDLRDLLWGNIIVPLSEDRRIVTDHFRNMQEMLEHMRDEPIPNMEQQNLFLSRFCKGALKDKKGFTVEKLIFHDFKEQPNTLDFETYPMAIQSLVRTKSFLKRFNNLKALIDQKLLIAILKRAQVELYRKDVPIFLNNRVGVVMMGSCEIRSHNELNLLKPIVVKKAVEGDIMGALYDESRDTMLSPLTWLMSMQDLTEVIYFSHEDFKKLWFMQRRFTEQFLVIHKLSQNKFFGQLNRCTKYHLVYECLDLRKFHPGQLMLSVHKRSLLSPCYPLMFEDGSNKFKKQIEGRIQRLVDKKTSVYEGMFNEMSRPSVQNVNAKSGLQLLRKSTLMPSGLTKGQQANNDQSDSDTVEIVESTDRTTEREESALERKKSRLSKLKTHVDDNQSNSTDYGVGHCRQITNFKEAQAKNDDYLTHFDNENEEVDDIKTPSKETESTNSEKHYANQKPRVSGATIMEKTKSVMIMEDLRSRSQSPPSKIVSQLKMAKTSRFNSSTRALIVKKGLSLQPRKSAQNIRMNSSKSLMKIKSMPENQIVSVMDTNLKKKTDVVKFLQKDLILEEVEQPSVSSQQQSKADDLPPLMKIEYNFLFQRYIEQIEKNDRPMKKELKKRKVQIKHIMKFVISLSSSFKEDNLPGSTQELEEHIRSFSDEFKPEEVVLGEAHVPLGSSGHWNAHLIAKLYESIQSIMNTIGRIESAQEVLLNSLIRQVDAKFQRQIDPDGIHFIAAGDALILGPDSKQNMKLHTNDCFGHTDYLRQPGPEYLGDVRAGIAPVETYFFSIEHLKKRISITEKLRMYEVAGKDERLNGIIKFMVRRDNITQEDKLKQY